MVSLADVVTVAFLAGAATGVGALPILLTDRFSHRFYDAAIGLAAGIMFGAAVFALVIPGLEYGSPVAVTAGVVLGGVFLLVVNRYLPHAHFLFFGEERDTYPSPAERALETGSEGADAESNVAENRRRALLVGGAVTIHNVPEGLAIGIAFASELEAVGLALAFAIAIQNVPDGFAMAVPASRTGLSRAKTVAYTTLSGAVPEPIAAAVGFVLVTVVTGLFPAAAGFAAGTMIAVVFRELIPASHSHGHADAATATFVVGFAIMLAVDVGLAV